jgi:hypothetical protein
VNSVDFLKEMTFDEQQAAMGSTPPQSQAFLKKVWEFHALQNPR